MKVSFTLIHLCYIFVEFFYGRDIMLRTIIIVLVCVLYLLLGIPYLVVEYFLAKKDPAASRERQFRCTQWIFRVVETLSGCEVITLGRENIPEEGGYLYISNHNSYFDIIFTYSRCPHVTGYISKKSMQKIPVLKFWMLRTFSLFLDREDPRAGLQTILTACDYIKNDKAAIFIFPEGTRSKTGEMAEFKGGSFKIATKTGCPIVPIAITNSADILEAHMPFVKKTKIVIHYGKPINLNDLDADDKKHIAEYTQNIIAGMLEEDQKYF